MPWTPRRFQCVRCGLWVKRIRQSEELICADCGAKKSAEYSRDIALKSGPGWDAYNRACMDGRNGRPRTRGV